MPCFVLFAHIAVNLVHYYVFNNHFCSRWIIPKILVKQFLKLWEHW